MKSKLLYQKTSTKSIIWIQTSFLGDIVISTAAFKRVKELMPDVKQYLITTPLGKMALKDFPFLDGVYSFDKKSKGFIASIKDVKGQLLKDEVNLRSSVILQAHKSFRSSILSHVLGGTIVTYKESVLSSFADYSVDRVSFFHEADRLALLLQSLGFSRSEFFGSKPFLSRSCSTDFPWFANDKPVVAIAPGSVWGTKRWPALKFAQLTQQVLTYSDCNIVFLGAAGEKESMEEIKAIIDASDKRILDLVGKTSLDDLRGLYPKLAVLVSNDSSPIHYASAFNVSTVAIFGATASSMGFGPLADESSVVEISSLKCRPCSDHGPMKCPLTHFKCMKDIAPDTVYRELESILHNKHYSSELHKID